MLIDPTVAEPAPLIVSEVRVEPLPARIGKYTVLRSLGGGATSEVVLARDDLGQEVAIKRLRLVAGARDAQLQVRFFQAEAAQVGRLSHPNVVAILDAVADPAGPYVVMEYVDGGTLHDFCTPDRLLSLDAIVEVGFKCAMALDYVARCGLIHRDIKPANILCTRRAGTVTNVKVTDFGSAFDPDSSHTQVQQVGSLAYSSPEQLDGGDLDTRADMYALAAVLYHLVAGKPPFEASTPGALMMKIARQEPAPLTELREGCSAALDAVIRRGLAKQPADRYATWQDFADALADLVAQQAVPRGNRQQVVDSERFRLLRSLDFFKGFDDVAVWEVVHRGTWQRLPGGHALYQAGEEGQTFYVIGRGDVEVQRGEKIVAVLGSGATVGEMAYLAPNPSLRRHSATVRVREPATVVSFTPETLGRLTVRCQNMFDKAFIRVLVKRLQSAHHAPARF